MTEPRVRTNLFRMAGFRLAVLGTLFSTIAAIIVFALIYNATRIASKEELAPIIAGDRADVLSDAISDRLPLEQELRQTVAHAPSHTFYALLDARGKVLFANITMPPEPTEWSTITRLTDPQMPQGVQRIDGIGRDLPNGGFLFIGEDASVFAALNKRVAVIFAVVFSALIGIGLLASLLIAGHSLKRVQAISDASVDIMTGDLSRRIEAYGIDDELDVLTEELNRMLETIEHLVENARQVTNDIAHDLRSPLVRLHEWIKHLLKLDAVRKDPVLSSGLEAALSQTTLIISVFVSLLRLAEVEAGSLQGGFTALDLSALVTNICDEFSAVAIDAAQTLRCAAEENLCISGDSALLTQLIVNLVENAIRYGPAGGIINVTLSSDKKSLFRLEIADQGPGIPEEDRDRVFRRFVRLDQSRNTPGHGLGLPLVRAIAKLHGAQITLLDNHPGLIVRVEFRG